MHSSFDESGRHDLTGTPTHTPGIGGNSLASPPEKNFFFSFVCQGTRKNCMVSLTFSHVIMCRASAVPSELVAVSSVAAVCGRSSLSAMILADSLRSTTNNQPRVRSSKVHVYIYM